MHHHLYALQELLWLGSGRIAEVGLAGVLTESDKEAYDGSIHMKHVSH